METLGRMWDSWVDRWFLERRESRYWVNGCRNVMNILGSSCVGDEKREGSGE